MSSWRGQGHLENAPYTGLKFAISKFFNMMIFDVLKSPKFR